MGVKKRGAMAGCDMWRTSKRRAIEAAPAARFIAFSVRRGSLAEEMSEIAQSSALDHRNKHKSPAALPLEPIRDAFFSCAPNVP
uniref:Uncharacterized protein n=1 Tax=Plectus sambesii TaxID=2011161 RepID=A0A914XE99_9BILA